MKFPRVETRPGFRGIEASWFVDNLFRNLFQRTFTRRVNRTKMLRKYSSLSWKWKMARIWIRIFLFFGIYLCQFQYSCQYASDLMILDSFYEIIYFFFSIYRKSIRVFGVPRFKFVFKSDLIVIGFAPGLVLSPRSYECKYNFAGYMGK